jgi:hypothetical protein
MSVSQQAKMKGYHKHVWYNSRAITKILALSNVIRQYRVTYDSDDKIFIVHRQASGVPNMEFRMHEVDCITTIHSMRTLPSSTPSQATRRVSHKGRSRALKTLRHSMRRSAIRPGRISGESFVATKSRTAL